MRRLESKKAPHPVSPRVVFSLRMNPWLVNT